MLLSVALPQLWPVVWLDRVRARVLSTAGPWLRPVLLERDKRAAVIATVAGLVALLGMLVAPLWWLALAPLVWGVPHLLSDIRYLLVRQGMLRQRLWVALGLIGVTAAVLSYGVRATLVAAVLALLLPLAGIQRRLLVAAVLVPLAAAALWAGWWADYLLAHGHNVIAFVLWWLWRPRQSAWKYFPLLAFAGGTAVLLSPLADTWLAWLGGAERLPPGMDWSALTTSLGAAVPETSPWAMRLVLWYGFAQAMHYAVWLHLLPSDDRPHPTPRSFSSSLRAWQRDLGWPLLVLALVVSLGLGGMALSDLQLARNSYFTLAAAHGHVELLAAVWLALRGVQRAAP